jgi:hypothetical protein
MDQHSYTFPVKMVTKEHIAIFVIHQEQHLTGPTALQSAQMVSTTLSALNSL